MVPGVRDAAAPAVTLFRGGVEDVPGDVAAAIFSRAFALPRAGLVGCGAIMGALPLTGDTGVVSSAELLSRPAWESADGRRAKLCWDSGRTPPGSARPVDARAFTVLALEATDDMEDCLAVRVEGRAGGPIEVRDPLIEVRGLLPTDETRVFEGVPVRDAEELGGPLSCLVGDFAGDLISR